MQFLAAALAGAAAVALAVAGGTRSAPARFGWSLLAVWSSLAALTHALWALGAIEPTVGSLATIVHVLAAPLAVAALIVLFRVMRVPGELVRRLLDGWLYVGTLLAVAIQFVVIPITGPGRLTQPGTVLTFVYFAFDLTVVVVLARLALREVGVGRRAALVGAPAVLAIAISDGLLLAGDLDLLLGTGLASVLAAVAYALLGSLPYLQGEGDPTATFSRRVPMAALAAPYAAALIGGGSLLVAIIAGISLRPVPVGLIASVVLALVVRQGLTLLDNVRLVTKLAERENHFRSLVLGSSDVIMVTDADGLIDYASPAMARIFGFQPEEVVDTRLAALLHPQDAAETWTAIRTFLTSTVPRARIEARLRAADGGWRHTESTLSRDGGRLIINVRDVSDRVALRRELERLALHDTLTGLPNRMLLTDRLISALGDRSAKTAGDQVGVVFVDLDGLKEVNDSSGHEAGDEVLVEAGRRIVGVVGRTDLVARFGGDEFVVVMDDGAARESVLAAAHAIVDVLGDPFVVEGRQLDLSASAGVAFASDGRDVPEVLRAADLAMYRAKAAGRGRIEVFRPELRTAANSRAELSSRLVRAFEDRAFALQYQPVVELATGRVVALEALVRWRSEAGVLVLPVDLIRHAEESGRITELGRWVVGESVAQAARWGRAGPPVELAVNLSAAQVDDPQLVDVIASALDEHGLPPQSLTLEITESLLLQGIDEAVARLGTLRTLGVQVVLDDFGTGYSSLGYLSRLPVDGLKLDASFVQRLGTDSAATAVTAAVVRLGQDLGLVITAEGVETPEQAQALIEIGCHRAQGFHFAGPLDVDAVTGLVTDAFAATPAPTHLSLGRPLARRRQPIGTWTSVSNGEMNRTSA